ncbi:hypothetical protein P389DRAFT_173716 [Cystobasidium minutum MCA 4210]|uniref:uncharacterized protein n=1 Tax=Cystobasidium minutum MCA 4210 TaxID=1397322 RepID=UPI0034CDF867|eukprot:jgi/Rhomi1/173716/fgenesh1_kg.6_\
MNTFTLARSSIRAVSKQQQRGIAISSVRLAAGQHNVDPTKASKELEKGKKESRTEGVQDNTVSHAPGWNEKVASESEAIIKGTKEGRSPQELVKETVEHLTKDK